MRSETPLSVLHICTERTLRGGERQCLILHRKLLEKGHDSYIACRAGSQLALQQDNNIVSVFKSNIYCISSLVRLVKTCRQYSISHIHAHDSKALTIASILKLLHSKIHVIYSRKSLFPIRKSPSNSFKYSRITRIIAISNAVADVFTGMKNLPPIDIIHDAVPAPDIHPDRDRIRNQFGLTPEDFCVGSVAFFTQEKNLPLLLQCADFFEKKNTSITFLLIGPVEPSQIAEVQRRKTIHTTGYLQNAIQFYPAFDTYISTSSSEGLGSSLIDAIVRDIPSVAMDAGGTKDCFGSFKSPAGTPEELFEQLSTIISDYPNAKIEAAKLGTWARSEFNVDKFVNRHIDIYRGLLQ